MKKFTKEQLKRGQAHAKEKIGSGAMGVVSAKNMHHFRYRDRQENGDGYAEAFAEQARLKKKRRINKYLRKYQSTQMSKELSQAAKHFHTI